MTPIITRFAPSPTGYLHIGSARTALFNWLFAKHYGGTFYLRIEDTDRERSTQSAVDAIFKSMEWLGLHHDGDVVFQYARRDRHRVVAEDLIKQGHAYYCYCTPEELEAMRTLAKSEGKAVGYNGLWRDRDPSDAPRDIKPVIRLKAPRSGSTTVHDHVQGTVSVDNSQLDDMILLRSDGTPTYMLSVVVDDHDMNITHVIRGDDHFTNTFRQRQLYDACGWTAPEFAHIPLIHGQDGAKLSKRHGALGTEQYKEMGFLADAMRNYLLRLGFGHGDEEIISTSRAVEIFDFPGIGKSPSRFDLTKLTSLNGHYLREMDNGVLLIALIPFLEKLGNKITAIHKDTLVKAMDGLKQRAKTLIELADSAQFYIAPQPMDDKAVKAFTDTIKGHISDIVKKLDSQENFAHGALEALFRQYAEESAIKLGDIATALRIVLTGRTVSPSVFEVMEILGKTEVLLRLKHYE